jgi:hypothetical protein
MPPLPKAIIEEPSISKYISNWGQSNKDVALVAVHNDTLIGAVWGRLFSETDKGYGFVDIHTPEICLAVQKEFRNRRIGGPLSQVD